MVELLLNLYSCLFTGSADRTVKFWDLETFELIGSTGPEVNDCLMGLILLALHMFEWNGQSIISETFFGPYFILSSLFPTPDHGCTLYYL